MFINANRFPLADYVRIVVNDALTFDPKSKKGGPRAYILHPSVSRLPFNRPLQGLINELAYYKDHNERINI